MDVPPKGRSLGDFVRPRFYVLNADNEPEAAHIVDWALWMGDHDSQLALSSVGDPPVVVSTVFLGVDCSARREGEPPICFETMCFTADGVPTRLIRYHTHAAALAGHAAVVVQEQTR
jgi:hypothetical protein